MIFIKFLALLPVALGALLPAATYDGYKVYRVRTNGDAKSLLTTLSTLSYQRWNERFGEYLDIQLSPAEAQKFNALGLDYEVMHEDLGANILAESRSTRASTNLDAMRQQSSAALPSDTWFNSYHAYADHVTYWKSLNAAFSNNSQYFVAGKSYENRDLFGLKLFGNSTGGSKPAVIWHSTVHAREWITTMTVEYLAYNMIKGYQARDVTWRTILDKFDVYILPVVNPDGFVYSQTKDRLWRKNRQPGPRSVLGTVCYGTDINRNWPYMWNGEGSSTNPCDQTYRGRAAGDTPENKALVSHMLSVTAKQELAMYIDWHSYSQLILSPYGYTSMVPANSDKQVGLAAKAAQAIKAVHNQTYEYGPSGATLYPTAGSSDDYATDIAGAEYAYAIELRDTGKNGFVLPADQIRPTGEELLAATKVFFLNM